MTAKSDLSVKVMAKHKLNRVRSSNILGDSKLPASKRIDFDRLFRAYDIRGVFPEQLDEHIATILGAAFAQFLGKRGEVVVGRDVRLSGERLKNGLVSGLISGGCNVTDVGVVSTPMVYFATNQLQKDAGIMITASHNPPEWNGFKLFSRGGCIYGEKMVQIKQIAQTINMSRSGQILGKTTNYKRIFQDYTDFVLGKIHVSKKLKIVADTSNGVCGLFVPSLFEKQECEILTLNEKPDGRFPAHLPEPKESTLGELKKQVIETKADFGVGFDGDGDRAVFVDEKGRMIPGDLALLIFAKDVLERQKGAKVVCELSCSLAVEEYVKAHGGTPIVEKVGHTFIMDRMITEDATIGGEKSGHFYFAETNGVDDAIFASLKMAEILSKTNEKLSAIFDNLPRYPSIHDKNFSCSDNLKFEVIERLKSKFKSEGRNILDMDGLKLLDKTGWVLLRPSNTEPIIRVTAEAKTEKRLAELYAFAEKELNQAMKGC
jgi:phosphomannomutase/phosphoglucomutase